MKLSTMRPATTCSIRVKGRIVSGAAFCSTIPGLVAGALLACSTSWRVMRPPGPLPCMPDRSMPRSAAALAAKGVILTEGLLCRARTFQATTLPPGPLPFAWFKSTPSFLASVRAAGLALTLAGNPTGMLLISGLASPDDALIPADICISAGRSLAGRASPSWTRIAITVPTGTVVPTGNRILPSTPLSEASTSTVDLSVSISKSGSPAVTFSPSALRQPTRVPSSIVRPMRGITI